MTELPFDPPTGPLEPDELQRVARAVAERPDLWDEQLQRDHEQRTYIDVYTDEHLGVWAISWVEDSHDTGFHDHDRSRGAVHVARGVIRHEHLQLGDRPTGSAVPAGEGYRFDETTIHRMRCEPGQGPTVTVHAYSPPLTTTGQYGQGSDELLHRVPSAAQDQLVPHGFQGDPVEVRAR